ncbi:MAG: DUF2470 domain-containing protein [Betaproteobacteria bacterium]
MSRSARPARLLLRSRSSGVLSTASKRLAGHPFGSALPYAVDAIGRPLILISNLAAHTQNILEDPRVSLCVHQEDVLAGSRVTIVGQAAQIDDDESARNRYLTIFPDALAYASFDDFHLYRIEPLGAHFIGGFADIHWFDRDAYIANAPSLDQREADIVSHMNTDHVQALHDFCRHFHGLEVREAKMLTIDCDGFDVRADARVLRMEFVEPVANAGAARQQLVTMAQEARIESNRL